MKVNNDLFDTQVIVRSLEQRINNVLSDVKSYTYLRIQGLLSQPGLGGGNLTSATVLFNALNLMAKVNLYVSMPEKFVSPEDKEAQKSLYRQIRNTLTDPDDRRLFKDHFQPLRLNTVDETYAFQYLLISLHDVGIDLGISPDNTEAVRMVWNGFRNKLAHVADIEDGKSAVVFVTDHTTNTDAFIESLSRSDHLAFAHDGNHRNWALYIDVLYLQIPSVLGYVTNKLCLARLDSASLRRLQKIIR